MLKNVTVYICKPRFALTPKKLQLIFDDKTIVVPSNDSKSYKSPLYLTQVKDVAQISDGETKCNIAGNIIEKQWQDVKPTYTEDKESVESNHLKLKIRDAEADIDISFFGEKPVVSMEKLVIYYCCAIHLQRYSAVTTLFKAIWVSTV